MIQEMYELFRLREPVPYIILAIFAVGRVIVFERFIALQITYRLNFAKFNRHSDSYRGNWPRNYVQI